jgi:hypothetical protein
MATKRTPAMAIKFDNTVSSGHILTFLTLMMGGAVTYGVHISTLKHLTEKDQAHERKFEIHENRFVGNELSIHNLEKNQKESNVKLDYLIKGVDHLEDAIKK